MIRHVYCTAANLRHLSMFLFSIQFLSLSNNSSEEQASRNRQATRVEIAQVI